MRLDVYFPCAVEGCTQECCVTVPVEASAERGRMWLEFDTPTRLASADCEDEHGEPQDHGAAAIAWLNTDAGQAFLRGQIERQLESGW